MTVKKVEMNDHEKEQHYDAKIEEIKEKYAVNIRLFHAHHDVDEGVALAMLLFNAKCFAKNIQHEVIAGGGAINVPELVKDYKDLEKYIVWQK